MKAFFRTEASQDVGMGHLMRCLALAQALSEQYVECCFVVSAQSRSYCLSRHDWEYPIVLLPESLPLTEESDWFSNQLELSRNDVLILDSYRFSERYLDSVSTLPVTTILFDDCNDRGLLAVDMVINSAGGAENLGYDKTAPGAILCLGESFRLLRREFLCEIPQPKKERRSLTIVMGGTDPLGLSMELLVALEQGRVDAPIRLVTTSANPQLPAIKTLIANSALAIQLVIDCQDLASIFSNSLITISAAGSTQFELLAMHCPSLLLVIAENQVNAARASEQQGWCKCFDFRKGIDTEQVVSQVGALWTDPAALQKMIDAAALHADLEGGNRIMDAISSVVSGASDAK